MSTPFFESAAHRPPARRRIAKAYLALMFLHIALSVLCLLVGLLWMDRMPWELLVLSSLPLPVFFAMYQGALKEKAWARYGSIALGVLMLPGVPLWTIAGGYLIVDSAFNWNA